MQPGAGYRGRQSAEFEVTAQRRLRFTEMESRADAGAGSGPVAASCGPWTTPALRLEGEVIARYPF